MPGLDTAAVWRPTPASSAIALIVSGWYPSRSHSVSAASSTARRAAMVPVLAVELGPLRVNAVSPGVIDTGWWDFLDAEAREQAFADFAAVTPAGRIGTPDDIASAIVHLVGNTFTSGVVLRVDGGARLGSAA